MLPRLPTNRTAQDTIAEHLSDHNILHGHYNNITLLLHNVRDFGAVGDDVADDTAAIQTTLNEGGITVFPSGSYRISHLDIPNGAVLWGAGSGGYGILVPDGQHTKLVRIANTNQHLLQGAIGAAHVRIHDLHLDGNKNNNTSGDGIHLDDAITAEEAQWHIEDCFIEANPGHGIYVGDGRRAVKATRSVFYLNGLSGARVQGSDSGWETCIFGSNTIDGIQVAAQVTRLSDCDVFGNTQTGVNIVSTITGVTVEGCGIDRNQRHGIFIAGSCEEITISNNILHSNSQENNGQYHHINVVTTTGKVAILGNNFTTDAGITSNAGYGIFLATGAKALTAGNTHKNGASNSGLTNDVSRLRTNFNYLDTPHTIYVQGAAYYYFPQVHSGTGTSGSLGNNTLRLSQIVVAKTVTLTSIGAEITSAGEVGSKFRIGIYADAGGYPGGLLLDAGQIAGDSATVQELAVSSLVLVPGIYWIGGVVQNAPTTQPTIRLVNFMFNTALATIPGVNATAGGYQQTGVTGALPSTFTSTLSQIGTMPRIFWKANAA